MALGNRLVNQQAEILDSGISDLKWEMFCQSFVFDKECRFNATKSYKNVYPTIKDISTVRLKAASLLHQPAVKRRLRQLLAAAGFNNEAVDGRLNDHIHQTEDRTASISAIREYNRLINRVSEAPKLQTNVVALLLDLMKERNGQPDGQSGDSSIITDITESYRTGVEAEEGQDDDQLSQGFGPQAVEVLEGEPE